MGLKVLLLNFPHKIIPKSSSSIFVYSSTINAKLTLHDFHAIFIDMKSVLNTIFWGNTQTAGYINALNFDEAELAKFGAEKVKEQIETGGITFCFSGSYESQKMSYRNGYGPISNRFCCPINPGLVDDKGDTFRPNFEELKYFNSFIKNMLGGLTYDCYFSKLPEKSRILGTNRAGYPVFAEVPIGNGKLVMLPRFKDMSEASTSLIYDVLPQMVQEENSSFAPQWMSNFESMFEEQTRKTLGDIEKTKRLLYTKDKSLKKAVGFAFESLGFSVKLLPDGTNPDIEIFNDDERAICEVKGHENRQSDRKDMLQLVGYSTEEGKTAKAIFASNHEFSKKPQDRSREAFTEAAIDLGKKICISLISTIDLFEITMNALQNKISNLKLKDIRDKIMKGEGIIHLQEETS